MSVEDLNHSLSRLNKDGTYAAYSAVAGALERVGLKKSGLPLLKVAVLRNFTFEPLVPVIKGEIAKAGFYPEIYVGEYDTIAQDALDAGSALYRFQPDFIIVAQWLEGCAPALMTRFLTLSPSQRDDEVERILNTTSELVAALRQHSPAPVLVNNFHLPSSVTLGILDPQSEDYQVNTILKLNLELSRRIHQTRDVYLVDYMRLLAGIGHEQGVDERYWLMGRAPIGRNALVPFGQEYGKFIAALRGKTRKCLVLDCDNILWGGVIGEDGLEGIKLGTNYPGSCYQAFQQEILNLHDRGVILALCSKNNEDDVLEALRSHPAMVLREENFSTWQINWEDKASNLLRIARDLNIGLEGMVFVDDSSFECDLVREQLPQVAVLQLASEPSTFKSKLTAKAYFDALTFSGEDRKRTQMYRAQEKLKVLRASAGSLEEYFTKLDMEAEIGFASGTSIQRISQLTQKTNQFNLTTRRYTEGEISVLAEDPEADVFHVSLRDRVSQLGLIGVAILKYRGPKAEIDTFLLSCRVIGRGVEEAMLAHVFRAAKARGCSQVTGRYVRTKKNGQVADFYKRQGFQPVAENGEESEWEILLDGRISIGPKWIKVNLAETKEKLCK